MAKQVREQHTSQTVVSEGWPADRQMPRLQARYRQITVAALMKEFGYKNPMQVPTVETVVLKAGMGAAVSEPQLIKIAIEQMTAFAGQRAVATLAKKSIANFKLRAGLPIGCMVTLRRRRMWEFLDRLFHIVIPRIRDFKGVNPQSFDGGGNYNLGICEQNIFPEFDYDAAKDIRGKGLNVTIITTAETDSEARALLGSLGLLFRTQTPVVR